MANLNKQQAPMINYLKALKWFRGGSISDNKDCYNYWKATPGGWKMLNSYLYAYYSAYFESPYDHFKEKQYAR